MPDLERERRIGGRVAGIDEAGRGPLAGPVVAAAVVLDQDTLSADILAALDDSKKLSATIREQLFTALGECATIGVAIVGPGEIDRINILQATMACMRRAVDALPVHPDHALVDGNRLPPMTCPAEAVVRGDALSASIAAASIVAKVTRDRIMHDLALRHPGYGWETNAGYGTAAHLAALARLGPTCHHRRSFAPVRALLIGPEGGPEASSEAERRRPVPAGLASTES